jgi:hypothetical protein
VNSETMVTPVLDAEALERAEAEFLRGEISLGEARPAILLMPIADICPLGRDRPARIDFEPLRPTIRTSSSRCC